jgi:hypothetical protein
MESGSSPDAEPPLTAGGGRGEDPPPPTTGGIDPPDNEQPTGRLSGIEEPWLSEIRRRRAWLVTSAALAIMVTATVLLYAVHIPGDVRDLVRVLYLVAAVSSFIALAAASWDLLPTPPEQAPASARGDGERSPRRRARSWLRTIGLLALALAALTLVGGMLTAAYAAAGTPSHVEGATEPTLVPVADHGRECGKDRWDVKTLSDPDARAVNLHAQNTTVAALGDEPKPGVPIGGKLSRLVAEHRTYTVRAELVEDRFVGRRTEDRDIHLVVADLKRPTQTMVVEMPDPECRGVRQSPELAEMSAARAGFIERCGLPPKSRFRKLDGAATIMGVAFFDRIHGKNSPRGHAPNGIELHPVLDFRDAHCAPRAPQRGGRG